MEVRCAGIVGVVGVGAGLPEAKRCEGPDAVGEGSTWLEHVGTGEFSEGGVGGRGRAGGPDDHEL